VPTRDRDMTKEIRLNAFDMNCVGHIQHGMWTHPRDRSVEYNTLEYWQNLARLAERGKFDGIFLADIVGVYDVYEGGSGPSIVNAVQIPVNDPMMVVPAMAAVTTQIGFGVTANLTYEPPYLFARRLSTLDHLTRGRVGWNIVTGYLDSAARGMGLAVQPDHDGRYDVADTWSSSTSYGRRAGKMARCCATRRTASLPTRARSIACGMPAAITG
jgi:alkanesulfonate monooxygenase SsuD/methylene tetrahydromethanopterin reductase-like flavin-dependent oxidoreductase (luciferase family)